MRYRLLKTNRPAEALAVISALEDKPPFDGDVQHIFNTIREAVAIEDPNLVTRDLDDKKHQNVRLNELFTGGRGQNLRRAALGVVVQCFQQVRLIWSLAQRGSSKD